MKAFIFKSQKMTLTLFLVLFAFVFNSGCGKSETPKVASTELSEAKRAVEEVQATLAQKEKALEELRATLGQKEKASEEVQATLAQKEKELEELRATLAQKETELEDSKTQLVEATTEEDVYIIVPQGDIFMRLYGAPPVYGARLDVSYKSADGHVATKSLSYDVCLIVKQTEFESKIQKIEAYTTGKTKFTICDNTATNSAGDGSTSGGDGSTSAGVDSASGGDSAASRVDDSTLCVPAHYTVISTLSPPNNRDIWIESNFRATREARHEKYIDITYPLVNGDTSSHVLRIVKDKISNTFKDRENCLSEIVL